MKIKVVILTSNEYKYQEISHYFTDIGIKPKHIIDRTELDLSEDFICVSEKTKLLNKKTLNTSNYSNFEEVVHISTISLEIKKGIKYSKEDFSSCVEGFIFPNKKTYRKDVYGWDDIFVSLGTMKTYQEMKDIGLKNSARDISFSKAIEKIKDIFYFENKINLNFNPYNNDDVISFEPFIKELFDNNHIYKIVYKNKLFYNLINNVLNSGLFIRRASDRKERNYWLPGLNAGIPLTPKKDELHELTFMFHDIMHFIYPDVMVVDTHDISKRKYIISRMMSEAFTLILADMLFIDILKESGIEYDYSKRKIYPMFEKCKFEITSDNIDKLKELLWANTCFALLGSDTELLSLVKDETIFNNYKDKYQQFFQEDYKWTYANYNNIVTNYKSNNKLCNYVNGICKNIIPTTDNYVYNLNGSDDYREQVKCIFEEMFTRLSKFILTDVNYNKDEAYTNAVKRYYSGQMSLFFKYETSYGSMFIESITEYIQKKILNTNDLKELNELYSVYVDKLKDDNFITEYAANSYKNICPIFDPFYVFYESKQDETFENTLQYIFKR